VGKTARGITTHGDTTRDEVDSIVEVGKTARGITTF